MNKALNYLKVFVIVTVVLISGVSVTAQDTLYSNDMRLIPNYYVPVWFDSFDYDDYFKVYHAGIVLLSESESFHNPFQQAWKMYTDDTLTVYGLAGSFVSDYRWAHEFYHPGADTSCDNSFIFMRLYEADVDSLQPIGETMVHLNQTPISYYIDLGLAERPGMYGPLPPVPMYERYFLSPATVADSFYVGERWRDVGLSGASVTTLGLSTYHTPIIDLAFHARHFNYTTNEYEERWDYRTYPTVAHPNSCIPFLFPIIAPPDTTSIPDSTFTSDTTSIPDSTFTSDTTFVPDTTQVVDSTARIIAPDLVYRYTAVQPNPATEKVRVTSSFGLGRIEAYDESGRRVFGTTASGMVATIDVASWKKGVYLLRIATGAGPTTKRLIVK